MPYYHISTGLRGCYMPDNSYIIHVKTRRELKEYIESEANLYRDAGFIGANKRAIASIAATQWRDKKNYFPYCLPLAPSHARDNYCHGVFVSNATRDEYKQWLKEKENE